MAVQCSHQQSQEPGQGASKFYILQHILWSLLKLSLWTDPIPGIEILVYIYTHSVYLYAPHAALEQNHVFFLVWLGFEGCSSKSKKSKEETFFDHLGSRDQEAFETIPRGLAKEDDSMVVLIPKALMIVRSSESARMMELCYDVYGETLQDKGQMR